MDVGHASTGEGGSSRHAHGRKYNSGHPPEPHNATLPPISQTTRGETPDYAIRQSTAHGTTHERTLNRSLLEPPPKEIGTRHKRPQPPHPRTTHGSGSMLIEDITTDEHRRGAEVVQSPQAGQWGREERGEVSHSSSTVEGEQQAATAAAIVQPRGIDRASEQDEGGASEDTLRERRAEEAARPPAQLGHVQIAAAVRLGMQSAGLAWLQGAEAATAAKSTPKSRHGLR